MEWTAIVSIAALMVAGCILVAAGCSEDIYRANWAQFLGIWTLSFWVFGRIPIVAARGYTDPWNLLFHIGFLLYLCGTAYKVIKFRPRKKGNGQPPPEIDARWWPRIGGGKKG